MNVSEHTRVSHCKNERPKLPVEGKSLLAIFPTGGGKSLTFQLPALMGGTSVHDLRLSFLLCSL